MNHHMQYHRFDALFAEVTDALGDGDPYTVRANRKQHRKEVTAEPSSEGPLIFAGATLVTVLALVAGVLLRVISG